MSKAVENTRERGLLREIRGKTSKVKRRLVGKKKANSKGWKHGITR